MDNREDQELDLWKVNKIDKPLSRLIKKKDAQWEMLVMLQVTPQKYKGSWDYEW